jgi:phosphate transport system substrate-binding protein
MVVALFASGALLFVALAARRIQRHGAWLSLTVLVALGLELGLCARTYALDASSAPDAGPPPRPPNAARAPTLILGGSNTIGSELMPSLVRTYLLTRGAKDVSPPWPVAAGESVISYILNGRHERVEISAHGSADAFRCLAEDACDIGMSSRHIRDDERRLLAARGILDGLAGEHVIGLDGIAVIVNYANPLAELSLEQVRAVFTGAITDWSALPGKKRGAIAVMARDHKSGTAASFLALALRGAALTSSATLFEDSRALAEAVAANPDAIGFVGWSYLDSGNRALRIHDRGSPARAPQRFYIATEEYLLSRRIYLYASEHNAEASAFLDFVLSDAGQEIVERAGFVNRVITLERPEQPAHGPPGYARLVAGPPPARRFSLTSQFRRDSTELDSRAYQDVNRVLHFLEDARATEYQLMVLGFAEDHGSPARSRAAAETCAEQVAALFRAHGVPVTTYGFGGVPGDPQHAGTASRCQRVELWYRER